MVLVMTIATVTDLRERRVPNWLVFPFILAGAAANAASGGWLGLAHSGLGILLAAALMGPLYVVGGMGMGDVKLCAGLGAWVGAHQLLFALAFMGLAGGVMAFGWALYAGFLNQSLTGAGDLIFGLHRRGLRPHETLRLSNASARRMPYVPAIAVGAALSFFAQ